MEFDWHLSPPLPEGVLRREVEESFEDPFGIRLMPELGGSPGLENRFFLLGRSAAGKGLFTVFWTDGKSYRVVQSREMTEAEAAFYDRRNAEQL
ncbi:MAG: hypothetical protein N2322_03810 [Terrimicrobiaceae bacterium]|nr:hypothetical protein [Terrimicrobiaceae bacterium]